MKVKIGEIAKQKSMHHNSPGKPSSDSNAREMALWVQGISKQAVERNR